MSGIFGKRNLARAACVLYLVAVIADEGHHVALFVAIALAGLAVTGLDRMHHFAHCGQCGEPFFTDEKHSCRGTE